MKLSKTRATLYRNLNSGKMRRRYGLFTVEGKKNITDSLKYYQAEAIITTNPDYDTSLVIEGEVPLYIASEAEMEKLSCFSTPSDIMGIFKIPTIEESPVINKERLYLMLDGVRDPGNLGTIIRTCHWFGIYTILASYDCVDCYNPKTVQSSMGSLGAVKVYYCDIEKIIEANRDMPVYGTLLEGKNIFRTKLSSSGFIVMGNEGKGISAQIKSLLTDALYIPPVNPDNHGESLNVAIAVGIVLSRFIN